MGINQSFLATKVARGYLSLFSCVLFLELNHLELLTAVLTFLCCLNAFSKLKTNNVVLQEGGMNLGN